MTNVQSIRQTGKQFDNRHRFNSNIFCQSDDLTSLSHGYCLSDQFDEHITSTHYQKQQTSSIFGISNGNFIHQLLEKKFHKKMSHLNYSPDWLMIFLGTKTQLFSRRIKIFDLNQYPLMEHWILMINCLCSYSIDFYFEQTHANQLICDYLDTLALKGISLEETHPWMAGKYIAAREQILRLSASLTIIEMAVETLIVYRETFQTFGQADKIFFDNCIRLIEQTRGTTPVKRVLINTNIVQSAIYFLDMSIKQFEIVFEPSLSNGTPTHEYEQIIISFIQLFIFFSHSVSFDYPCLRSTSPPTNKRMKTMIDPSYIKSLELAHELLLLPYVAFTRTSVYSNSKIKRYAVYLDIVIDELKKHRLLLLVRQGVQMIDGTRRRVDLLVKTVPILKDNHSIDMHLKERLNRFSVDYEQYIQTLATLDIGEKYRLSEQCYNLLNSSDHKRYLTVDLERLAPINRIHSHETSIEEEDGTNDMWKIHSSSSSSSSSSSCHVKNEPADFDG